MIVVALALWTCLAYALISRKAQLSNRVLTAGIAFLFSVAITSFAFFISLCLRINFLLFQAIFTLLPFCILAWRRFRLGIMDDFKSTGHSSLPVVSLLLVMGCIIVYTLFFFNSSNKWGYWDGWAIWSLHARFLIYGNDFLNLFTSQIEFTHPDYPLMLPSIIAVLWKSFYSQSSAIPLLVAYSTGIIILLVLVTSFIAHSFSKMGIFLLTILSCTSLLYPIAGLQYADTLLGLFILVPFVLFSHLRKDEDNQALLFLMGFFAASCGWIKNEGLAFFGIFTLFFFISAVRKKQQLLSYLSGCILPLLIIILFKVFLAPANDLVEGQNESMFDKLSDAGRYSTILNFFFGLIWQNMLLIIALLAYLVISIGYYKYVSFFPVMVLLALLASYFFIYVITPRELNWHLATSFDRLLHQLIPAFLFSVFENIRRTPLPDSLNRKMEVYLEQKE